MAEPKLRFKREDGTVYPELRNATMGDFYTERNERGGEGLPVLSVSIHSGVSDGELDEDELGKRVKRSADLSLYKKAMSGDLVLNMMRAWQGAVGCVKTTGMVSPAYIVAEPNGEIDPTYMDYYVQTKGIIDRFNRLSYGALDFRKRLYWDSFVTTEVNIPVLEEQKRIAGVLEEIDAVIAAGEDEVANLERQKKAAMQKIFSQEVRFKREDGNEFPDWESHCFCELALLGKDKYTPKSGDHFKCIELEHLDQSTGTINGYVDSDAQSSTKNKFYKGDILFGKLRPYLRKYHRASFDGVCSTEIWVFKPTRLVSSLFLLYLVSSENFITLSNVTAGSKMPRADWALVSQEEFDIPCPEEQRLIADFLSSFDDAIKAAKQEQDYWKALKRGLLQQMFV